MPLRALHVRRSSRGFTLIELLIAIAIAAIIATIALPSFLAQVRMSRRSEAMSQLALIQQAQERWRANCPCYAGSLTAANVGCPATDCDASSGLGLPSSTAHYGYTLADVTPSGYTLRADGSGSQASDTGCTQLTVAVVNGSPTNSPAACFKQ